ncbi:hypothetical protein [Halopiger djelfimassiliensis]|uniref:hypothetical protein n=1 Tax=Halopiger djelfimassiliensis TaxID=1293047 RepID=UPI00067799FE|nr:hypothetical protein [Halopiger djelfimassiliensis]
MTTPNTTAECSPKTSRTASNASYGIGIVALVVGLVFGRPVIGLGAYVGGFALGAAIPSLTSRPVYDERDDELAARANELVLSVLGFGGFAAFVSLWILSFLGRFTWRPELLAVFWAWCAFWLFWGSTDTYVRLRARR